MKYSHSLLLFLNFGLFAGCSHSTIPSITGTVTTLAGTAGTSGSTDATGSAASFQGPRASVNDIEGNVYVVDSGNSTIRKITPEGVVTTIAGTAGVTGSADGPMASATFNHPVGLTADRFGNLYVADTGNHTIRKITVDGTVSTFAGITGTSGSSDGAGTVATFASPEDIIAGSRDYLYVSDTTNMNIRMIDLQGNVYTVAGQAGVAGSSDGASGIAQFNQPRGLALDYWGNLFVADYGNNTIRWVHSDGRVTTLAGLAGVPGSSDGNGTAALFNGPTGILLDANYNFYISDSNNSTIRKMESNLNVSTLAGSAGVTGSVDGTGSAARFVLPLELSFFLDGSITVSDENTIRYIQ